MKTLTPKQLERKARRERQRENANRIEAFTALRDAKIAYIAAVKRELTETDSMSDARWIPAQPDAELVAWHERSWVESVAIIEATCRRTAMEAAARVKHEPIADTIKRATGYEAIVIDGSEPDARERMQAAIRANFLAVRS